MKGHSRSAFTAPLVTLAGTVFLAAPAVARRDDVPIRPQRNSIVSDRRETRQALRLERERMHETGRERRNNESMFKTAGSALQNNLFLHDTRAQNRLEAGGRSSFLNSNDKMRAVTRGLELDLTSDSRSIVLGENLFEKQSSYTIKLGDQEKTVSAGSQVSPAEFVALQQVLNGGKQELVIDSSGRGVDGHFNIDSITDGGTGIHAKSLVIPSSVEASGSLSRSSDFRLTGDLINNGSVYLTDAVEGAKIAARDVSNNAGALIHGLGDLTVSASRDLSNSGTISADGTLSISAGHCLSNSGVITGRTSLIIESPAIQNSGSIETPGSVNISTPTPSSIYFDSTGGSVKAGGSINFRSPGFGDKVDTTLVGGDWTSSELNLYSGDGNVRVNVDDITGGVTVNAGSAVLNSGGPELHISELATTGDPLISSPGAVYLPDTATYGAPLSVIAGQDIFVQGSVYTSGGDIILIAGAQFAIAGNTLEVTGASATGGRILGSHTFNASNDTGDGGNILLAAFGSPSASDSGRITMDFESEFRTEGATGHANGNVTFIAPNSMFVGQVKANGAGTSTPGDVYVSGSQPLISGPLTIDTVSGALLSGSLTGSALTGAFSVGAVSGGQVSLSGRSVYAASINAVTSVTITSVSGAAAGGAVKTPLLNINMGSNGYAYFIDGANQIGLVQLSGGTSAEISSSIDLHIGSVGANQSLTLSSNQSIIVDANLATTGDIVFATNNLQNVHSVSANSIRAYSPTASITVDGGAGGSFAATGAGQKIAIGSWVGGVTLSGALNFSGETDISSFSSSPITIAALANVTGNSSITLNASNIVLDGLISADPLVLNYSARGGTIANSQGNIILTGPIIMNGGDLAIVAANDILATGPITINTSSGTGSGGDVFIWAGANLTPQTPGQVSDSFTPFTVTTPPDGIRYGNVLLSSVDITTSSLNGAGGDVTVVSSWGTISLGNIDAAGTVSGGNIKLYGQGGVDVGSITSAGTVSGAVEVVAGPVYGGPLTVYNGSVTGTLSAGFNLSQSDVNVGAINSGSGSVYVRGFNLTFGGPITAHQIYMDSSAKVDLTALTGIVLQQDLSGNGGALEIDARNILVNTSVSNPFRVTGDGDGDGNGGSVRIHERDNLTHVYVGSVGKPVIGSQFFDISAKSGDGVGGNGGLIEFQTGGDLTVNSESLNASAIGSGTSNGASYMLTAGASVSGGRLLVVGDLIADGINGGGAGRIELQSGSAVDFILNAGNKTIKSGVTGVLSAIGSDGIISIVTSGDIAVKTQSALQVSSDIVLSAGSGSTKKSSITAAKNVVLTANNISLFVDSSKSGTKLAVNANYLHLDGAIKSITSIGTGALEVYGEVNSTDFSLDSQSAVNIRSLHSYDGGISVTATTGGITLLDNFSTGAITAAGNIKLHALDEVSGSIHMEANTEIYTLPKGGNVTIAVGKIIKGRNTEAPVNVSSSSIDGGKVSFEPGPNIVVASGNNSVGAKKHTVLFSSSAGPKITFDGGNQVYATDEAISVSSFSRASLHTSQPSHFGNTLTDPRLEPQTSTPALISSAFIKNIAPQDHPVSNSNRVIHDNAILKQVSALPTDLLTVQFDSATSEQKTSPLNNYSIAYGITDAYVWSDRDFGVGKHRMLKSNGVAAHEITADCLDADHKTANNSIAQTEKASIRKGTMLLCPSRSTQLETPLGVIDICAGAVVFVSLDENRLAVYDLHDEHKGAVKISAGNKSSCLHPGRFILVTGKSSHAFEDLNPMEAVGYKSLETQLHGDELKAFSGEFSTTALLSSVIPLREILASSHFDAKKLSAKLVKTSAVLMHLGSSEEFRMYSVPNRVAHNR